MGPRAGLDVSEKRKSLVPAGILTPDRRASNDYAIPADVRTCDINMNNCDLNDSYSGT